MSCTPRSEGFQSADSVRVSRYSAFWVWARRARSGSRYSSAQTSNGANSHLCGSTMTESACSTPAKVGRIRSTSIAARPYAPSMCSHTPRERVTSAIEAMSVDDAEVRGPPGGDDCEHRGTLLVERPGDGVAAETPSVIRGGRDHVDVHDGGGGRDGGVRLGAAHDDPARGVGDAVLAVAAARGIPSRHERRQIADRAALHEDAAGGRRAVRTRAASQCSTSFSAKTAPGALHPRAAVDRGCRHHEVEGDGGLARRRRDERQVSRMVGREARGRQHVLEEADRAIGAHARGRDGARGGLRELFGRTG